ncbi:glutathione S-transferase-like [Phymastichus coffea]|uniref:glutathione S-transferase-like n=1 Tax=Phymastichus coffea TaxID=108790 RepID=UPI00273C43D4|nr:glutathione S-transferase-like [Phymastichus coffea]XP_058795326.1 glutathione S-transferase-like [Phymastichus coffea]
MPVYKLMYFNIKGIAESIRWLFAYAGVNYEDRRVSEDEWKTLKPTMPFNQMPVLDVDGKRVNQSTAICRYLAKQFGLAGNDDWENFEIDAVVDTINDLRIKVNAAWYEKIAESKVRQQQVAEEMTELFIDRLEDLVKCNGGHLVGGKLTWADIMLASTLELINFRMGRDVIEKAERLKALRENVQAVPAIKAWLEKRPKTDY